ncbi:MAG: hypothetical protein QM744_03145 [Mesorhizobium sp.]
MSAWTTADRSIAMVSKAGFSVIRRTSLWTKFSKWLDLAFFDAVNDLSLIDRSRQIGFWSKHLYPVCQHRAVL